MDTTSKLHPTDQTLRSFGLGMLDDASGELVQKHLEGCPDCRRHVAEVTSDTFLDRLRNAQDEPTSPPPFGSSLAGLSRLTTEAGSAERPPDSALPPGLARHPDYEVIRELGQGGMGVVYLAQNKLMKRKEVLKVVGSHLINRPGVMDRFLTEIGNAGQLHHANIVTAYAALRLGESIVFAMEYVEGLDLSKLVKARGPLPVAHACNYIHQAALGLEHAHEQGMVHRDIKPSNLMLSRHGNRAMIKVLDFGLAKVKSEGMVEGGLTHEGQMLGTPEYVAPEQTIDARNADIRADIYSLGCTLYYLLTGGPPFQANSLYELLQAHHSMDAMPLNLARPDVPVEVAAIAAKMMAKEPERRFQAPLEVANSLRPFFKSRASRFASVQVSDCTDALSPCQAAPTSVGETPPVQVSATLAEPKQTLKGETGLNYAALEPRAGWRARYSTWIAIAAASAAILFGIFIYFRRDKHGTELVLASDRPAPVASDNASQVAGPRTNPTPHGESSEERRDGRVDTSPMGRAMGSMMRGMMSPQHDDNSPGTKAAMTRRTIGPQLDDGSPRTKALRAKLDRTVAMRFLDGAKLGDVLNRVRLATTEPDGLGVPIYVDPSGLQEAGKSLDSLVRIDLETSLNLSLDDVLEQVGLACLVKDGLLFISTSGKVASESETAVAPSSDGSPESVKAMAKLGEPLAMPFADGAKLVSVVGHINTVFRGRNDPGIQFHFAGERKEADRRRSLAAVLELEGVPLRTTLRLLLAQHGLAYTLTKGVVHIDSDDAEGMRRANEMGRMAGMMRSMMGGGMMGGRTMGRMMGGGMMGGRTMGGKRIVPSFDGKDAMVWRDEVPNTSEWRMVDRVLEGHGKDEAGGGSAVLHTERFDFQNFRLRITFEIAQNVGGIVVLRAPDRDDSQDQLSGYAVAIGTTGIGAGLPNVPLGSIAKLTNTTPDRIPSFTAVAKAASVAAGGWHTVEISAEGEKISTRVDGKMGANFRDPENSYSAGSIVLACRRSSSMRVKGVEIEELPPPEIGVGGMMGASGMMRGGMGQPAGMGSMMGGMTEHQKTKKASKTRGRAGTTAGGASRP